MRRVLVTGAAGTVGQAVARRLIADPQWEMRASDQHPVPDWIADGAEVHSGDLRDRAQALQATEGCS